MLAALAFFAKHWQLVLIVVGATAGAVWLAVVLRNWKIAAAAAALVGAFLAGQQLWTAGYESRVEEEVAARTAILQERVNTLEKITAADGQRAHRDAQEIARLSQLVAETPENTAPGLPRDAVRRIRGVK